MRCPLTRCESTTTQIQAGRPIPGTLNPWSQHTAISSMPLPVDEMTSSTDHLTTLPSELLQAIASYLFATHEPDKALQSIIGQRTASAQPHDLESLAATCRILRNEVNNWALHFLLEHRRITGYAAPESAEKAKPKRPKKSQPSSATLGTNFLRISKSAGLLSWSEKKCVFCGKTSARSAIMMNGLKCCKECDKVEWKDKITKTDATKEYDLKDHQLLPQRQKAGPILRNVFKELGIPRLRYGTYVCQGGTTTMFMREDVRKFAEQVHGGLREHLAQRELQRAKLKKTREANKERRAEEQAARVVAEAREAQRKAGLAAANRQGAAMEMVEISDDEDVGVANAMDDVILIE